MSKHDKLRRKFCRTPYPRNFKFDELVTMLAGLGFTMHEKQGGSSHKYFVRTDDEGNQYRIDAAKPHPHNTLKVYQVKEIHAQLKQWGLL